MACFFTPGALQLKCNQVFVTASLGCRLQMKCRAQAGSRASPKAARPPENGSMGVSGSRKQASHRTEERKKRASHETEEPKKRATEEPMNRSSSETKNSKARTGSETKVAKNKEGDAEEVVVSNMTEWMNNKPSGFGVGREYDTGIEAELMADIEKERELRESAVARRAEMRRLEELRKVADQKKKRREQPDGVRVLVKFLPKKKNILRDLNACFKGERGLLHIRPNEIGNIKTRDPVCKGSASLTFVDRIHALKFIDKFEKTKFVFGSVVKYLGFQIQEPQKKPRLLLPGPKLDAADVVAETASNDLSDVDEALHSEEDNATDTDEVQDSLADAILDDENGQHDTDGQDSEYSDDDDEEDYTFKVPDSVLKLAKELEEEEEDSDYSDDSEDGEAVWASESDNEEDVVMNGVSPEAFLEQGGYTEIEIKDLKLEGDQKPEELLKSTEIYEVDSQINKLMKKLRRRRTKELEDKILKLREHKIELLEKRILAKIVAAKEVYKRKREKRRAALQEERRAARFGDKRLPNVVTRRLAQ